MGEATENDEGAELDEDPTEGEDGGAGSEVEELEGDGKVGQGDEEIADFLAVEDVLDAEQGEGIFVAVAAACEGELGRCCERKHGECDVIADPPLELSLSFIFFESDDPRSKAVEDRHRTETPWRETVETAKPPSKGLIFIKTAASGGDRRRIRNIKAATFPEILGQPMYSSYIIKSYSTIID